jgi:hypothetical protein
MSQSKLQEFKLSMIMELYKMFTLLHLALCRCIVSDGGLMPDKSQYDLSDGGLMPDRSKYDLSEGGLMPWWYHMHIEVV